MSPNFLGRRGWTKNTFEPGDKIKVVVWPLKSGEPGGTLQRATLPDGTEVQARDQQDVYDVEVQHQTASLSPGASASARSILRRSTSRTRSRE